MSANDPLNSPLIPAPLREALRLSPDNVPLLAHAADLVLKSGGIEGAEALFKKGPPLEPDPGAVPDQE